MTRRRLTCFSHPEHITAISSPTIIRTMNHNSTRASMFRITIMVIFLIRCIFVESQIFLRHTNDGMGTEHFDCIFTQSSLWYCRRSKESLDPVQGENHDTELCARNGGETYLFSELRSKNISISTVQYDWVATLEQVEEYSLYLRDLRFADGHLCRCLQVGTFGMNCEYQLPVGKIFEETLRWQLIMTKENQWAVNVYGDILCYETLQCNSGVLCLDWREICDGVQQCMSGWDEENCDLLEMNRCDEDEYRCENGMCIPDEFFLDGTIDCLDWSDEMRFKDDRDCPEEGVSIECDDHLCPSNRWSCGDGECIADRLHFQKSDVPATCGSQRDQYFFCETHLRELQWTMPNGRCHKGVDYEATTVVDRSEEEECEYIFKCALSFGVEIDCPCNSGSGCAEKLVQLCQSPLIQYPRGAIVTPYTFFFYNRTRHWQSLRPDMVMIHGTIRCRNLLVNVTKLIPFEINLNAREITEDHFCQSSSTNIYSSENIPTDQECHHANESTNICDEWNQCLSITRIKDGRENCLSGRDEHDQIEAKIEKSCASVQQRRLRCSIGEPTCLSVTRVGNEFKDCRSEFDELWFGVGRTLRSLNCNDRRQDECLQFRYYIDQSWRPTAKNETRADYRIPFRSYCDTFEDLRTSEDENVVDCRQWWNCSGDQLRCRSGQCIQKQWENDHEWDCTDASDE